MAARSAKTGLTCSLTPPVYKSHSAFPILYVVEGHLHQIRPEVTCVRRWQVVGSNHGTIINMTLGSLNLDEALREALLLPLSA